VGPESAGAEPGPICYGKGARKATLTDANLVLGYINPDNFAGGSIALDLKAAERGIRRQIAEPLGLSTSEAAWGVHAVANAAMERAIRSMSMERGRDPRNYAMVAFGGAGPLHAGRLARALGVSQVIVPWGAGVGSAVGLLDADPKFNVSRTHLLEISPERSDDIAAIYRELEQRVRNEVREIEQAPLVEWKRFAFLRYQGQGYELKIDLPPGDISSDYASHVLAAFHETYQSTYGYSQEGSAIEATDWHLTAIIPTGLSSDGTRDGPGRDGAQGATSHGTAFESSRKAYFTEFGGYIECKVVDRYALRPGDRIEGPAIVEEREATTVVLPGDVALVRPTGNLILTSLGAS
ncbi:MAG: hydantoinase/oxoprolinase family protein, partial [SAR324 cluster bacterium]|nr:hydantoinase/oxoprolinase family protein [SAR324 cluster bacterium]